MYKTLLKDKCAIVIVLFIAMLTLTSPVQAQTMYDLWISNSQVSSNNCNDLSMIAGVSGKVIYDPETKTLTLENATINSGENDAIS